MSDWRESLQLAWRLRKAERAREQKCLFPLVDNDMVGHEEIESVVETLLDSHITMGDGVLAFERELADLLGVRGTVMVNSGSSASLLTVAVACNPLRKQRLLPGDEVLVPAVCWPGALWPLALHGLKPKFVDVDPTTLNVDVDELETAITDQTRAIMAVHILGNSAPMDKLTKVREKHQLLLIEDTCESLSSTAFRKPLGTFGEFGFYSFYYSHHITTGEGGAVACDNAEDLELLRCLRANGWTRALSDRKKIEEARPDIDPRFFFCNVGFNLKPMEIQGIIGIQQLAKLKRMNACRASNYERIREAIYSHRAWNGQLLLPEAPHGTTPTWFGFAFLLHPDYATKRSAYSDWLDQNGVEHRPIVSGNIMRHPVARHLSTVEDFSAFPGAEMVHAGFFIGVHSMELEPGMPEMLADILLGYDFR